MKVKSCIKMDSDSDSPVLTPVSTRSVSRQVLTREILANKNKDTKAKKKASPEKSDINSIKVASDSSSSTGNFLSKQRKLSLMMPVGLKLSPCHTQF